MTAFAPMYRLTVYAEDDSTVLTPRVGASHSEAFKVATASGITGFQPYMDFPYGRRGRLDVLSRKADTGALSVRVLDKGAQTAGWLTAFVGDTAGRARLSGRKVYVEQNLTGAWSSYYTGRITSVGTDGRLWIALSIRDLADDLDRRVFANRPHTSVAYALPAPMFPVGFVEPYGDLDTVPRMRATVSTITVSGIYAGCGLSIDEATYQKNIYASKYGALITKGLHDLAIREPGGYGVRRQDNLRVRLTILDGAGIRNGESGEFMLEAVTASGAPYLTRLDGDGHRRMSALGIRPLASWLGADLTGADGYMAVPPDGATVAFDIVGTGTPTEAVPLLLVGHPVQIWKDLLDGKFGRLGDGVVTGTYGDVTWTVPYDAAAFAALIADTSIPTARFRITEPAEDMREWVEENICKPYGLAYYLDADGSVVPIDLRLPSSVSGLVTIGDEDLVGSEAPVWEHSTEGAVTMAEATYYIERELTETEIAASVGEFPDIPSSRLEEIPNTLILRNFSTYARKESTWRIDATGFRAFVKSNEDATATVQGIEAKLQRMLEDAKSTYACGPMTTSLACRRTANTNAVAIGDLVILDVSELPDPASLTRGGARLARCTGVQDDGIRLRLSFIDMGPNTVAVVPTFGTPAQTSGLERSSITIPVTLNASTEPALVEYAVTATSVAVRPDEDAAAWTFEGVLPASGSLVAKGLPSNSRIWIRARTQTQEASAIKLPSAWAFPTPAYIDTSAIPAPTAVVANDLTSTSVRVTWTAGLADVDAEVWLVQGVDEALAISLAGNANEVLLYGLDASTAYTVKVRHRDVNGGYSAFATASFSTTATPPVAPRTIGVAVLVGRRV